MATLTDLIAAELSRASVSEQTRQTWQTFERLLLQIGGALMRVAQPPPSPGYEPWFVERGAARLGARGLARILVHAGHRRARDNQWRGKVVKALRRLAKPHRLKTTVAEATLLLSAWAESSALETIFDDAGRDVIEFVRLLKVVRDGDTTLSHRLNEIAVALGPSLTLARGPKRQAESEAHAFFLETARPFGALGYTWDHQAEDFTDPQTQATRLEFRDPAFNPIRACQLAKRRLSVR